MSLFYFFEEDYAIGIVANGTTNHCFYIERGSGLIALDLDCVGNGLLAGGHECRSWGCHHYSKKLVAMIEGKKYFIVCIRQTYTFNIQTMSKIIKKI